MFRGLGPPKPLKTQQRRALELRTSLNLGLRVEGLGFRVQGIKALKILNPKGIANSQLAEAPGPKKAPDGKGLRMYLGV